MAPGSLTIVGMGYKIGGHITVEGLAEIQLAEAIFSVVDSVTQEWLVQLNPAIESLADTYDVGKDRAKTYREMVRRILAPVRAGRRVCAVFTGHPGVACDAGHESLRKARKEGYRARMLPGISAEDCLFADLGIDPSDGCQNLEATSFLISKYRLDVTRPVILWQAGAVGVGTYFNTREVWNRAAFDLLVSKLIRTYSARHRVTVYEASAFPVCGPIVHKTSLAKLPTVPVTLSSTIYIPPLRAAKYDRKMLARLDTISDFND